MNHSLVQRVWRTEFKNEKAPDAKAIKNIISNFEKTGSVVHIPRSVRDPTQKRQEAEKKAWNIKKKAYFFLEGP